MPMLPSPATIPTSLLLTEASGSLFSEGDRALRPSDFAGGGPEL